jgi:hypothetical protein
MGTYVNACRERKSRTATTSGKAIPQIISNEDGSSGNSSQAAGEGEQPCARGVLEISRSIPFSIEGI